MKHCQKTKSELIKELAKKYNLPLVDVKLST